MIYISSPYSHKDSFVMELRYKHVLRFTAALIERGFNAFSPIVHGHHIKLLVQPKDHSFWLRRDTALLRKSEAMYLLELDGWQESIGVGFELRLCNILDIPVVHYSPKGELLTLAFADVVPTSLDMAGAPGA